VDPETAARAWVEGWSAAWPARDAEAVAPLYTDDAVYRSHPFREPHLGRAGVIDYARTAFEQEDAVEFWFGEPVAAGKRAAVEYWAILESDGRELTLAGTTVIRFAPDGRCEEHRDYWSIEEGRRRPPEGWGNGR
jgi:ketosteroid isomerase-like protein